MTVARGRYASSARYRGGKSAATSNTETTNSSGATEFTETAFGTLPSCGACQALTSCARLAERHWGRKSEFTVVAVVVLVLLLGIAFAAGYFTRDYVSRKRRAEARRWREYSEPDWLSANAPANTNEIAIAGKAAPVATGELGQMLNRWEQGSRSPHGVTRRSCRRSVGHTPGTGSFHASGAAIMSALLSIFWRCGCCHFSSRNDASSLPATNRQRF